jgi:hypothetical protein
MALPPWFVDFQSLAEGRAGAASAAKLFPAFINQAARATAPTAIAVTQEKEVIDYENHREVE